MENIFLLNKIAKVGLEKLDPAAYNISDDAAAMPDPTGIMVRSAVMHDMTFGKNLLAIARAGAGVNNIPVEACAKRGIVVFNTPGANANGVKELAICALMLASRDIVGGIMWANTLTEDVAKSVEKGKSKFAGVEIKGKKLGVVGLGAIGGMVANTAIKLGMKVVGCDPFLSVSAAWNLDHHIERGMSYEELYKTCDYITLHVPATKETKGMINAETIAQMKDGVRIINLSRADLVNAQDLRAALESGKVASYVTDFPTEEIIGAPHAVTIPHLGASTEESEDNCAVMAAMQLDDYIANGNITNSVNFPSVSMARSGEARICVLHENVPNVLSQITSAISGTGANIENMMNKSRGEFAYTLVDVCSAVSEETLAKIVAMDGIIKVRVI